MKSKTCNVDLKNIGKIECSSAYHTPIKKVYFNPETKEVLDEFENLLGTGEMVNGKLIVTRKQAKMEK